MSPILGLSFWEESALALVLFVGVVMWLGGKVLSNPVGQKGAGWLLGKWLK